MKKAAILILALLAITMAGVTARETQSTSQAMLNTCALEIRLRHAWECDNTTSTCDRNLHSVSPCAVSLTDKRPSNNECEEDRKAVDTGGRRYCVKHWHETLY